MSSRTPNDILRHRTSKTIVISKNKDKGPTSTRLKDIFINNKQREELMTACSKGDLPKVVHLLKDKEACLDPDKIRDSKLRTPLLVACAAGQAAIVRQLIRWGADVNNPMGDIVGNKPLDLAVISNNVDTVLALLENGAKIANYAENSQINRDDGLPLPVRLRAASRTPLDLANARLDLLIKQSEQTHNVKKETMDQVIEIIKLLKHCIPNDTMDELNELTDRLSAVNISSDNEVKMDQDIFMMKSLRDVISKLQI